MKIKNILFSAFIIAASFSNVYAQFFNTVSLDPIPVEGGEVTGEGMYPTGTLVSVEAKTNDGYLFVNWTENSSIISEDSVYSFIINGDRNLEANFELRSYLIGSAAEPIEGGSVNGTGTYYYGDSVNLEALPNIGYNFISWTENSLVISTDSIFSFIASADRNITANFELKSYLIESSSEPAEGGSINGTGTYFHGDSVNFEALPNIGYNFISWAENSLVISTDSLYSFIASADRNITANFELRSYLIESNAEPTEGGSINGTGTYFHGDSVIVEAIPNLGYSFVNWTENDQEISTDSVLTFYADANRNFTANFIKNIYQLSTISEPLSGGTTSGGGSFTHGEIVSVVATPASGYFFHEWTESDTVVSTDSIYFFTILDNRNLKAVFYEKQFVVSTTVNPILSGTVQGDSTYTNLHLVNLKASSNIGWKFKNWTENENIIAVDSNYSFIIFEDKNFTANFTKLIYNVETNSSPNEGGNVYGEGNYTYDSLITVKALPKPGYNFISWNENDSTVSTDSIFVFNLTGNRSLTAVFAKKLFSISSVSNPINAGVTFGDSLYTFGDFVNIKAIADSSNGWEFTHWSEDGIIISNDSIYSFIADTSHNLIANFQLKNYFVQLIPYPENAGDVDGLGTYIHGENVTVKAMPQNGWLFANWTDGQNNISDEPDLTFTIDENKTLIANFAHELYFVNSTAEPSEAGYVSGSGTFYYNQIATLTPIANPGWEFLNWTQNDVEISTDSLLNINITESINVKANFQMINYSINCSTNPLDAGYTSGCGISRFNQEMTLIATPNNGWEFLNWTENGDTISTEFEYNFNVTSHRNVVANFQLVTGIEDGNNQNIIPDNFYLTNAYPNPFNPSTNITFGLPVSSVVKIIIFNINGEIVSTLLDQKTLSAGIYTKQFNADKLTSGIYFYVITAQAENKEQNFRKVGKMILLK